MGGSRFFFFADFSLLGKARFDRWFVCSTVGFYFLVGEGTRSDRRERSLTSRAFRVPCFGSVFLAAEFNSSLSTTCSLWKFLLSFAWFLFHRAFALVTLKSSMFALNTILFISNKTIISNKINCFYFIVKI